MVESNVAGNEKGMAELKGRGWIKYPARNFLACVPLNPPTIIVLEL